MAKQRIHTIKNKILVQGDENLLTNNEILVTETPEGVSLKERTSEGIKTISGGGGGGEVNTIYAKIDFSLAQLDIPEEDDEIINMFYQFIAELFMCSLYQRIGGGYPGNMVSLPWMNLSLLGFGGYVNFGSSSNPYINERYIGFFSIPTAVEDGNLIILNPYMSNFICNMIRDKQPIYFKIDLPKCGYYSRESSVEDPKTNIIDIDSTKISKYSELLRKHPISEIYPPEAFEYADTLVTLVSKEEVDRVFDMYCEMYFTD